MTMMEDYFQDTIRLQLKKPKKWNWELSTSKSSPHIQLPIIQLYDAKGNLLVEAKDNGRTTERRSWHSSHVFPFKELPTNVSVGFKESTARHLQRCKSDTLDLNVTGRNNALRNKKRHNSILQYNNNNNKFDNKFDPSSSTSIIEKLITDKCFADGLNENSGRKQLDSKVSNGINGKLKGNLHHLRKSRSELYNKKKSDDLFERKLKHNNVEDIPLSNTIPNDDNNENGENFSAHKTRYKTRTCSAGTLIISEESFNNSNRQRRRRRKQYETDTNTTRTTTTLNGTIRALQQDETNYNRRMDKTINTFHNRQTSDPIGLKFDRNSKRQPSVDKFNKMDKQPTGRKEQQHSGLFYSLSNVFPFEHLLNNTKNEDNVLEEEENCNYIVQEPTTTPNESRKNSESIIIKEKTKKKKYRKVCRQYSDETTTSSSSSGVATLERRKYHGTKSHLIKDHHHHHHQQSNSKGHQNGETDLLHQLVKRLSSSNNNNSNNNNNNSATATTTSSGDHVKMGANVSRHSAKGLSGRRSQSSGSICNGKGRHNNDGKICSSLPSYLDERDTQNGCNNNHHDCEKPPLDEVERIPPLGDGAPLHWKFSDNQTVLCDQGYGSERSPEEEYPPPLPDHDTQCHHHLEPHACYPFVTPESTFIVKLTKGSRGLGLSVTGGIDSNGSWPGLIRIKRLFPHQPASACGLLNVGDLLLEANGITLTGLTNYEALEVLRTAPNQVDLKVCRPPPDVCVSPVSTEVPPPPPRREPPTSLNLTTAAYSTPEDDYYHGEFEVTLTKIQGSLGFTLRKEDDSALGHYVRALVREPALTDGRIRPGDKIIAVNDVEISPMSHEQAVQFLRQCGDIVKLLLYRDSAQTPVAALSPTETTPRTSFSRKPHLRQEAVDMLNDIAVRKLIPGNQDNNTYRRSLSPNASPRRLRRQPCPSDASTTQITTQDSTTKYMLINDNEQFHEGLLQKCSAQHPYDDDAFNSLFSIESDDGDKPSRPSSLDLYNPNQTPVATRKPRFNFSLAHNAYELNNLDPEVLDAPNLKYNLGNDDVKCADVECGDSSFPQEPASMPHIPIDNNKTFSHKNPAYQSAHPQFSGVGGNEEKTNNTSISSNKMSHDENITTATTSTTNTLKKSKSSIKKDSSEKPTKSQTNLQCMKMQEEYEILAIELNRGWNSRLGFSLQGAAGVTYVSAVHADSVAAKDGRLKPGDRVIKVNDESVEHMNTSEIIDLLRIVRGPVCIVVSRIKSNEDCPKSNAAN